MDLHNQLKCQVPSKAEIVISIILRGTWMSVSLTFVLEKNIIMVKTYRQIVLGLLRMGEADYEIFKMCRNFF